MWVQFAVTTKWTCFTFSLRKPFNLWETGRKRKFTTPSLSLTQIAEVQVCLSIAVVGQIIQFARIHQNMTNTIEHNRMHRTMYSIVWVVKFSEMMFFSWVILIISSTTVFWRSQKAFLKKVILCSVSYRNTCV